MSGLEDVRKADGHTPCLKCGTRPPINEPWTIINIGTTVLYQACLQCWLDFDDMTQPPRDVA